MLKLRGSIANGDYPIHAQMPEVFEILKFFGFADIGNINYFKLILSRAEVVVLYAVGEEARKRVKLELIEPTKPNEDPHYEICKFLGVAGMYCSRVTMLIEYDSVVTMDIEAEPLVNNEWNSDHNVPTYKIKEEPNA